MHRFTPFALRDLAVGALTGVAWYADRRNVGGRVVGVAAGVLTALMGFAAHEWGHLGGAVAAGGVVEAPQSLSSVFLFHFDTEKSDRRAFVAMSVGGYAGTVLASVLILKLVPRDRVSGRVALAAAALGALATFALEMPTTWRVARGAPMPTGGVFAGEGTPSGSRPAARC